MVVGKPMMRLFVGLDGFQCWRPVDASMVSYPEIVLRHPKTGKERRFEANMYRKIGSAKIHTIYLESGVEMPLKLVFDEDMVRDLVKAARELVSPTNVLDAHAVEKMHRALDGFSLI